MREPGTTPCSVRGAHASLPSLLCAPIAALATLAAAQPAALPRGSTFLPAAGWPQCPRPELAHF